MLQRRDVVQEDEAEVCFTSGAYAAGQVLFRAGGCPGQWDVELVAVDPARIPPTPLPAPPSATSDGATPLLSRR
ncbi:MAG: hypothetical protein V9G19_24105 [Tetrasphaera sp.]